MFSHHYDQLTNDRGIDPDACVYSNKQHLDSIICNTGSHCMPLVVSRSESVNDLTECRLRVVRTDCSVNTGKQCLRLIL